MAISELKVMKSAAGFYVGRSDDDDGFDCPYSRESGYYPTREAAEAELSTFQVRICAENEYAYETGVIPRPVRP